MDKPQSWGAPTGLRRAARTFASPGFLGPVGLNDPGDAVFDIYLQPFTLPFGVNAGAYRYSHTTQKLRS